MVKIFKIESCLKCCLDYESKIKLKCPMAAVQKYGLPVIIASDCPLDDLENCEIKTTANNTGVKIK